jgi:hypothetical protein
MWEIMNPNPPPWILDTWETTIFKPTVFADNFPVPAHNQSMNKFQSHAHFLTTDH